MSQWGLLALFQAATAPLMLLDFGMGAATVKYVAEAIGRRDQGAATRAVQTTLLFNVGIGLVGLVGLVLLAPWLATSFFSVPAADLPRAILGFRLMGVSWLAGAIAGTFVAVLAAHQRYDAVSKLATAAVFLSAVAGLAVALAGGDVVSVLLAQLAVSVTMGGVYLRYAGRLLPGVLGLPRWDAGSFRRSFSFGAWHAVGILGGILSGWSDRYTLGAFLVPAAVGFYAVVHSLYTHLYGAFLEMGEVLFPAVSHREGQGDLAGARRLALLVGWTVSTCFGPCAVVLATVGGDFLHLWISPEAAREATVTLRILCAAGVIGIAAIAPFYFLLGIGKTRWHAVSSILVGLTTAGVSLALVPTTGLPGVGYGLLAGVCVRWVLIALIWRHHFSSEFQLSAFAAHVWAPPLVSMGSLVLLTRIHDGIGMAPRWWWLAVESAVALTIAALVQIAAGELVPGGSKRRRDVVSSFRPLIAGLLGNAKAS
jgi:O-antigen/teichoic acid export membrane protein